MKSINLSVHPLVLAAAVVIGIPAIAIAAGTVLTPPVTATGTSSTPIFSSINKGSGPAIQGSSLLGKGIIGSTSANSTSLSNRQNGILGEDSSTSGAFDAGVRGVSKRGFGVSGTSSSGFGVEGDSSSGNGVGGTSINGNGVTGASTQNTGLLGSSTNGIGVLGVSSFRAIQADNTSSSTGFYSNGFGGLLFEGNNSSGFDVFQVDDAGNVFAHTFNATLALNVTQPKSSGGLVNTYTPQLSSPSVEDVGEAAMVAGAATVRFDSAFSQVMDKTASYSVFITPEGDNRGLYVAQKSSVGFAVRESQGGHSTLAFSYRVVARPFGNHGQRLPIVIERPMTRMTKQVPQI